MTAQEIKRQFPATKILALAAREGLHVGQSRMECPSHCCPDKRAVVVRDAGENGVWFCHHCGQGGSIFELLAALKGLSVKDVIVDFSKIIGSEPLILPPQVNQQRPSMDGGALWNKLQEHDSTAETYLKNRGLEAALPFVRFNTGGSDEPWLDALAHKGYRLAVPLRDKTGTVRDFQLRSINPSIPSKEGKRFLKGSRPRECAFGRPDLISSEERIFIAEGMADTLTLQAVGVGVALGAPGCDQLRCLAGLIPGQSNVILCPQNDSHNKSQLAFANLGKLLSANKSLVTFVSPPADFKDIAEWYKAAPEAVKEALLKAKETPFSAETPPDNSSNGESETFNFQEGSLERFSDVGNSILFAKLFKNKIIYVAGIGWHFWTGNRWKMDQTGCHYRLARGLSNYYRQLASRLSDQSKTEQDPNKRNSLLEIADSACSWAHKCESLSTIESCLKLAKTEKALVRLSSQLDSNAWLFNCENGTIDLKTGKLLPHDRKNLITKLAPVRYDPNKTCSRLTDFLESACGGDESLIACLQASLGYSITGDISEEKLFLVHGKGGSGKSTLLESVKTCMGEYCKTADFDTFVKKHQTSEAREDVARLAGARTVMSIEVEEGKALAEKVVKSLTGGDTITARYLYRDSFEFTAQLKLWLACNDKPRVRESDSGMWRRIVVIPVDKIPKNPDKSLKEYLKTDLGARSALLTWLVQGCLIWQQKGLLIPKAAIEATEAYRLECDPVETFLAERCNIGADYRTGVTFLRDAYEQWCNSMGERHIIGLKRFNDNLERHGFKRVRYFKQDVHGYFWEGLQLRGVN
jgi:P4 family phage/plasmid primase-like protien